MVEARVSRLSIVLSLALAGCGSSVDAGAFADDAASSDAADGTLPDGVTPGDDAAPDATLDAPAETPVTTTLDNVCGRWADAVCATPTKDCCTRRAIAYDEAGCRKAITTYCTALVGEVKAAQRTFNASMFDACAQAWRSLETTCSVPFLEYVKQYAPCQQMFPGTVGAGKACTTDLDCIAPTGGVAFCSKSTNVCSTAVVVPKDGACGYDPSALRLCDAGLYCPAQTGAKCQAATPVGGSCNGVNDVACGLGFQCAKVTGNTYQCKLGLPYSAQCTAGLQCASWSCDTSMGTPGACTDPYAQMASPAICQGVP